MTSVTSSSDSEDDEEKRRLAQAVDPDFLKNRTTLNGSSNGIKGAASTNSTVESCPVSKRSKLFDKSDECNDFAKPYSLDVTPECQKFIAKQLSKSLEGTLKEVSTSIQPGSPNDEDHGIKLFASSQCRVTEEDLKQKATSQRKSTKRKRKKKKSADTDSSSESENEKLKSVAVTADWVLNSI